MARRLFVGMFLPSEAAREIHSTVRGPLAGVRGLLAGAAFRLVPPEEIHLTLCFLGATEEERIAGLVEGLTLRIRGLPAPRLRITRTGTFPEAGSARVLWTGVEEEAGTDGRLEAIARAAAEATPGGSCDPEEPFHAHLTVARPSRRGRSLPPEDFRRLRLDVRWHPREVRLVESRPGESGDARFPEIASFELLGDCA